MRILLLLCALSFSLTYYAQPGGNSMMRAGQGGRSQNGIQNNQQRHLEKREFNASNAAGIFSYDDDDVITKIKLKKKDEKLITSVRKAIVNYNIKIQEIGLLNKDNFDTLNIYVNTMMKSRASHRNRSNGNHQISYNDSTNEEIISEDDEKMHASRKLIRQKIEPAKIAVKKEEVILNNALKAMLNEKQYKKWAKYQEAIKDELNPKPRSINQNNQMRPPGGGMGGRMH